MERVGLLLILAVLVEALTEYVKNLVRMTDRKAVITQMCALGFGILLCMGLRADMFELLGIPFRIPVVGCILTGVFASRGANYMNDLIGRLQTGKIKNETEKEQMKNG